VTAAALLDDTLDRLVGEHAGAAAEATVAAARAAYEDRRGRVFQDEPLWERWSAAFVEWFVIERCEDGAALPPAARSLARARDAGDLDAARAIRAWLTSHRSLFEVRALTTARVVLLDLLGGAQLVIDAPTGMEGVTRGDVAELRVVGFDGTLRFGRTFVFHPRQSRDAILAHARRMLAAGLDRRAVIDHVAALRVRVERYRHMAAARVYELPTEALAGRDRRA
jgi:hypothetical protein